MKDLDEKSFTTDNKKSAYIQYVRNINSAKQTQKDVIQKPLTSTSLKLASSIISQNPVFTTIVKENFRSIQNINNSSSLQAYRYLFEKINKNTADILKTSSYLNFNKTAINALKASLSLQRSALLAASGLSMPTAEITKLANIAIHTLPTEIAYQSFISIYKKQIIETQNLALLKIDTNLRNSLTADLPKSVSIAVNSFSLAAAIKLSSSDTFSYDTQEKVVFNEKEKDEKATIKSFNVIVSALELLNEITDEEMVRFHTYLCSHPLFGLNHPIGKKINDLVLKLEKTDTIGFDHDNYYRARPIEEDQRPWTEPEIRNAPYGIASQGRFNASGISYFYTADTPDGAMIECRKHNRTYNSFQIGRFSTRYKAKILDIVNWRNSIAKYCKFSLEDRQNTQIRPEYLVPCFFAECLQNAGVDGIKYFGGKGYSNYVFWEDHYFTFEDFRFQKYNDVVNA